MVIFLNYIKILWHNISPFFLIIFFPFFFHSYISLSRIISIFFFLFLFPFCFFSSTHIPTLLLRIYFFVSSPHMNPILRFLLLFCAYLFVFIFFPFQLTSHTHNQPWSFDLSSMFAFLFFIFFLLHLTSLTHTADWESWPSSIFVFLWEEREFFWWEVKERPRMIE